MTDTKPDFQWKQQTPISDDALESKKIFKAQTEVMRRLFRNLKNTTTLVNWHERRMPGDLHLYAAFGLVSPIEYEYFKHQMDDWQENHVQQTLLDQTTGSNTYKEDDDDDDDDDEVEEVEGEDGSCVAVIMQPRIVGLYLQHLATENFDQNEHLLLRFEKPIHLVGALYETLKNEVLRGQFNAKFSVVNALLGHKNSPVDETTCWNRLNLMAAGASRSPMKLSLRQTKDALKKLNDFQLYKAVADIYDYSMEPEVPQRLNGQLVKRPLERQRPRIHASLNFLLDHGLLETKKFEEVVKMSPERRQEQNLVLKRTAVSSLLADIEQVAPDAQWMVDMAKAVNVYFHDIIKQVGSLSFGTEQIEVKNEEGRSGYQKIVRVSFSKPRTSNNTTHINVQQPKPHDFER